MSSPEPYGNLLERATQPSWESSAPAARQVKAFDRQEAAFGRMSLGRCLEPGIPAS